MENLTKKNLKEAEEVLTSAVERKITIEDTCMMLDISPDFMSGIAGKIERAYKADVISEKQRDKMIGLYSQYTKIIYNNNKKLKKLGTSKDKAPIRLTKGPKSSKATKTSKVTKVSKAVKPENKLREEKIAPAKSVERVFEDEFLEDSKALPVLNRQEQEMLEYNADADENYEERSVGEVIRGNDTFLNSHGDTVHKIVGYKYKIFIRDERPLAGEFSREEMDKIYRLYSSMDGAGLTLRAVSREFHLLNYRDFKRILRAFNITKASLAVAPHVLEEYSEDEIVSLVRRNKENSILKKLDLDRQKYYEKKYYETKREIGGIKSNSDWVEQTIESYFTRKNPILPEPITITPKVSKQVKNNKFQESKSEKPLFCIFGDIHFGKKFDNTIFGRGYNKNIAHERMMEIAAKTIEEANAMNTKEIVAICLGDLIECAMEDGMHPGHSMEMDLFQDEQIFFATDSLIAMFKEMLSKTDCKITFCSIHGNHDRVGVGRDDDKSRTAGKVITGMVKRLMANEERIEVVMPKNNLLKMKKNNICVFAQHGDSSLNKRKPSELINLFGEGTSCYHLLLKGHWHSLKVDEGTNFLTITAPSVASADKYILEELGHNNLPGFILGSEPDCYGFDYKKITLY